MGSSGEQQSSSLSTDFQLDSSLGFGWATQGLSHSCSESIPTLLWLYALVLNVDFNTDTKLSITVLDTITILNTKMIPQKKAFLLRSSLGLFTIQVNAYYLKEVCACIELLSLFQLISWGYR
jgi:hypothetical protein